MDLVIDIETSLTIAEVNAKTQFDTLHTSVFALHPWIAVTSDEGGLERRWTSGDAPKLLETLRGARVIGWNILAFDLPIIVQTALFQGVSRALEPLEVLDVFEEIRRETKVMFKLEEVTQLNFDTGKLGKSVSVPARFQAGDLEHVYAHCARDVDLEWRVYRAALTGLKLSSVPPSKYLPDGLSEQTFTLSAPSTLKRR
jgi:hypothetical protein